MSDDGLAEWRARRLIELVDPHFPVELPPALVDDSWPMTAHALIARMTGTLQAILQLRPLGRYADATILARSLFEHAVTFAWLAAGTDAERQRRFAKSDSVARLRIDDDCRALGHPVLIPEMRAWHEENREGLDQEMPGLLQRAEQADREWAGKVPGLHTGAPLQSYRGLYALMYRNHSGYAHPSGLGLLAVAEDLPDGGTRVALEAADENDPDPLGLAMALYTYSLLIAAQILGLPDERDIEAVWNEAA
jgi:hypothetical protein